MHRLNMYSMVSAPEKVAVSFKRRLDFIYKGKRQREYKIINYQTIR